ncbi:exosome complex component RRP45-like [Ostrea edulis]|uniref:exosome complex component RRP45-like n=1 Tax=Ostrea edulis TaxID=37623 RepID=UPI0024AE8AA9|nr:exosome complex component RRP45-like [Ostrea edulis]
MRDTPLSTCERTFIIQALGERKRLDGRQPYDYRKLKITFGADRGCCKVNIGQTLVLAQVSCEIASPRAVRPSDGILFVNVELSPMASPAFEAGRMSDLGVEINRLLERCLRESRCVDTESLCIISGEKVWQIRVDVNVMNHDGNIVDCCSIAAIAALAHFRRPDVSVDGSKVIVHPSDEKDPIPLSVHHMPICVTFSFYDQGKFLLVDPTDKEEKVMDGKMVIGMNKHREICTLQVSGEMLLLKDQVLRCSNIAVVKVAEITELIQTALENDRQARLKGEKFGFAELTPTESILTTHREPEEIQTTQTQMEEESEEETDMNGDLNIGEKPKVKILEKGVGMIGEGGVNTWGVEDEDMTEELQKEAKVTQKIQREVAQTTDDQSAVTNVWIVGSSIVYWAESRAKVRGIHNLTYNETEVAIYWDGMRGMRWDSLMVNLQRDLAVWDLPEPDVLVIHLGSNDVASWDTNELINRMKGDLTKVTEMFPTAQLVYSELLARRVWRGMSLPCGEAKRQQINREVGQYVTEIGGIVMSHDNIIHQNVTLYIKDGVHMNDYGNDVLLEDLMECLSGVLEKPLNDNRKVGGIENNVAEIDEVILTGADLDICHALPLSEVNKRSVEDGSPHMDQTLDDFMVTLAMIVKRREL